MSTQTQEAAKLEQLAHENPDEIEIAAGREREQLEGWVPELAGEAEVREALEKAFDYRGDITMTRKDGSKVEGYLYDRRTGATLADSFVRIMPCERGRQGEHCLLGDCGAGVYRARQCGGEDLRRVGEEVLGEEGGRRKEHSD